jgi:hypothetical protein
MFIKMQPNTLTTRQIYVKKIKKKKSCRTQNRIRIRSRNYLKSRIRIRKKTFRTYNTDIVTFTSKVTMPMCLST